MSNLNCEMCGSTTLVDTWKCEHFDIFHCLEEVSLCEECSNKLLLTKDREIRESIEGTGRVACVNHITDYHKRIAGVLKWKS